MSLLVAALLAVAAPSVAAPPDEGVSPAAAAAAADEGSKAEPQGDAADEDADARLTAVSGPVYVRAADRPDDGYTEAETDMPIGTGDEIRVGEGGSAELSLEGDTVIQLSAGSDFVVNSLAPAQTEFHLGLGSLVAKVKHLLPGRTMEFHTPTALAAVRGTELGVSHDESGESSVGVFDEGRVSVRQEGEGGKGEVTIGPNQETRVRKGKGPGRARQLSFWVAHRERLLRARQRAAELGKGWQRRPLAQRLQWRQQWLKRPGLSRQKLNGLTQQQRGRDYGALRKRQQMIRARRLKVMRQRQLRQQQQARREQMRQQWEQRKQQMGQRMRQKAQQRQAQAEQRQEQAQQQPQQRRKRRQKRQQPPRQP